MGQRETRNRKGRKSAFECLGSGTGILPRGPREAPPHHRLEARGTHALAGSSRETTTASQVFRRRAVHRQFVEKSASFVTRPSNATALASQSGVHLFSAHRSPSTVHGLFGAAAFLDRPQSQALRNSTRFFISSGRRLSDILTRRRSFSPTPSVCWRIRIIPPCVFPWLRNSLCRWKKSPTLWVTKTNPCWLHHSS